jgi:YD repeat-containing protein
MRDDECPKPNETVATDLERRMRSLSHDSVPQDLLARCLATVEPPRRSRWPSWIGPGRWTPRVATAAAALILIGALVTLARPKTAAAAGFLQAVRTSWTEVPACHRVITLKWPNLERTMETWFVAGKGGRLETRSGDRLIGVVANNGRWEFRWDPAERLVAAWSTSLIGKRSEFASAGLVQDSEALVRWAEAHRAEIKVETDLLAGRKVRKVTLRWPGPAAPGPLPQVDTIWFDPDSLRPIRQRSELGDGGVTEATFDYPTAENVPADLLTFQPPRDVTLEINDPDLGRQVYSEPRAAEAQASPPQSRGGDR